MKIGKVLMTGVLTVVLTSASFAAVPTSNMVSNAVVKADQDNQQEEIKVSELPDKVQEALKGEAYKGWDPQKAFVVNKGDKKVYKVKASKGEEKVTLLFNENGEPVKK